MFIALKIPAMTLTQFFEPRSHYLFGWKSSNVKILLLKSGCLEFISMTRCDTYPLLRPFVFATSSFLSFHLSLPLALRFCRYQVALYTFSLGLFCFFQIRGLLLNQDYVRYHLKSQTWEENFFVFPDSMGRLEAGNNIMINKLKLSGISH